MNTYLEFEKPIAEAEGRIRELRGLLDKGESTKSTKDEISKLEKKSKKLLTDTYAKLDAWKKTLVARHPERPHAKTTIEALIEDFTELAGDRGFSEDQAIIGGIGRFRGLSVMVIGNEKGSDTNSRLTHNFGMARPEGYRKVVRLMDLAERFELPIITLVDTPGAYPGIGAEERGQAEAIARSTEKCLDVTVPLISIILGEGGSGGAVALATANKVIMLEHSVYSVISPEGCASILWRDASKAPEASMALKLTAQDLLDNNIIDQIIPEPVGGAHRDPAATIADVGDAIQLALDEFDDLDGDQVRAQRREKYLKIGTATV